MIDSAGEPAVELTSAALALQHVTKRFGKTVAVDDASLTVRPGTIHALLGENGAGKSTLMRVAFGMIAADAGRVFVSGSEQALASPSDALRAGVGMVHQHFTNIPAMTVAENVALGDSGRFDKLAASRKVVELGETMGLRLDPTARVGDLPVGAQQRLEILKSLGRKARVLILDEPTAVLAPSEAEDLLTWLRAFAARGNSVVIITHKLVEALSVADDVTVMRRGKVVLSAPANRLSADSLATAIVGETVAMPAAPSGASSGETVAQLTDVDVFDESGSRRVTKASMTIQAGEIVGIAGVEGAGQRELLRVLASRIRSAAGRVVLPKTIGFIPEDRHADALVLDFSLAENIALRHAGRRRGVIRWEQENTSAARLIEEYDVRGSGITQAVRSLSGGNQQKLVLGRELSDNPALVIAENPTRGLDIRAAAEVRSRLKSAAANGAAVVIYSSDLDEVLATATRLMVMHAGKLKSVAMDREAAGRAMLGLE